MDNKTSANIDEAAGGMVSVTRSVDFRWNSGRRGNPREGGTARRRGEEVGGERFRERSRQMCKIRWYCKRL